MRKRLAAVSPLVGLGNFRALHVQALVPTSGRRRIVEEYNVGANQGAIRGSCLCGTVRYVVTGHLTRALYCHCSMCRKAHGTAFRARAAVSAADFRWTGGEDAITWFESSPGNFRGFCRNCGSPLLSRLKSDPTVYGLPLGALDDAPDVTPCMHVHVASKAPWFEITDDLRQFAERPV